MLFFLICGVTYFLPAILGRNKRNFGAILALNFLLGWTIVGWFIALIWALAAEPPVVHQTVVVGAPARSAVRFCCGCGAAAPFGAYCSHCGKLLN